MILEDIGASVVAGTFAVIIVWLSTVFTGIEQQYAAIWVCGYACYFIPCALCRIYIIRRY